MVRGGPLPIDCSPVARLPTELRSSASPTDWTSSCMRESENAFVKYGRKVWESSLHCCWRRRHSHETGRTAGTQSVCAARGLFNHVDIVGDQLAFGQLLHVDQPSSRGAAVLGGPCQTMGSMPDAAQCRTVSSAPSSCE